MLTEQQKRDFCAALLKRYGIQIDLNNELLPVFFVAYQSALFTESTSKHMGEEIQRIIFDFEKNTASKLSKMEVKQYRFQSPKEAFCFAFGKYGMLASIISIFFFGGWVMNHYQKVNDRPSERSSFLIDKSPVMQKQVNDSISARFIRLYPSKDLKNALVGKNYVFRKECQCIDIPLYFEKRSKNEKF